MSDSQYSSPKAERVNMARFTTREAGDLANGSPERGQDVYDPAEAFPDKAVDWYTPMDRKSANFTTTFGTR